MLFLTNIIKWRSFYPKFILQSRNIQENHQKRSETIADPQNPILRTPLNAEICHFSDESAEEFRIPYRTNAYICQKMVEFTWNVRIMKQKLSNVRSNTS